MEKLIFEPTSFGQVRAEQPLVRIDEEAAKCISTIVNQTGLSRSFVASQMIKFAFPNVEIQTKYQQTAKPIKSITIIVNNGDESIEEEI